MVNHMLIQCQPLEKTYAVLAVWQFAADNAAAVIPDCPDIIPDIRQHDCMHKQVDDSVKITIHLISGAQ